MLVSPVFARELVTAPRRTKHYVARGVYVAALLMLMGTAWLVLAGSQTIRNYGDLARFGAMLFQILAPLQLAVAIFFSALFTASSVSQEKDRKTLVLLLMTELSNFELVVGKLFASLLTVIVLILAAFPVFMSLLLVGGVNVSQIIGAFAVTVASAIAAGSLGSTIALWREKTFQALAMTALAIVALFAVSEALIYLGSGQIFGGVDLAVWAKILSPWRSVVLATSPAAAQLSIWGFAFRPELLFLVGCLFFALVINVVAICRVRLWNPSRNIRQTQLTGDTAAGSANSKIDATGERGNVQQAHRQVGTYPVLWREVHTWAYGKRVLAVRFGYLLLAFFALWGAHALIATDNVSIVILPFFLMSMFLVNSQAVTAISTERDMKTLDLLLVTDLTPREFIFGKLIGVFFNTKEMVALPIIACGLLLWWGAIGVEDAIYMSLGLFVINLFVAVLGLHCGLIHENSRISIATSLGTVFFLFVGIATCMRIMVAFSGSFGYQLAPFLAFMLGGGVGLYVSLGARNASAAIFCAAFTCPFLTFYAITSYLQAQTLAPFLVASATYLFTTLTMLIPAISEFDLASGRMTEE
ncbi:MAG: ABC transporter permease [Planctomycetales bacterium]